MSISLPASVIFKTAKNHRALVTIEPCYPGYGVTLGNALRRVLLSSIQGGAITAFKVKGAQHEFSHLPNVKEDLIEIILNLKAIRLKVFSAEPVVLTLHVKGEKTVTVKDIEKNAQVESSSPEQKICTLTDPKAELEMELVAQVGYGYVTVEEREKEKADIGTIMIDAIYSPLVSVGFEIENVRVGDRTDYERLLLKLETDGTISPEEALHQAADLLVAQFQLVSEQTAGSTSGEVKSKAATAKEPKILEEASADEAAAKEPVKKKRGRPKKI